MHEIRIKAGASVSARASTAGAATAQRSAARRSAAKLSGDDRGAVTAEYAIATLAAVGLAGLLVVILRSDAVRELILGVITQAFGQG